MHPLDFVYLFAKKFAADNLLWIPSENLISDALQILFKKKGIFSGTMDYPTLLELYETMDTFRNDKLYGPRYRDIFEASMNRFRPYLHMKNFVKGRGIPHKVFCTENVVLELPLNKVPDAVHNFLGSWILNLTYSRNITLGLRGNSLRHFSLIDEARTNLNANREHSGFDNIEPGLLDLYTKGREFGIGLCLGSQEMKSFRYDFKANCLTKISFALAEGQDFSEAKESFGLNDDQKAYLYQLPEKRVAVCRFGSFERPFIIIVPELHGLDQVPDDKEVEDRMADFYARIIPKDETYDVGTEASHTAEPIPSRIEIDGSIMIRHLLKHPFMNYKHLITQEDLSPTRGDDARAWMIRSRFAVMHSITLRRGKPGEYFELTPKAYEHFGGTPPAGKGGFEHKCFCHTIKDSMEEAGFDTRIEGPIKGSSKLFDVLAWKKGEGMIGYEVTLTFHNLIKNLRDDLGTTVKKVIVVCRNKDELQVAKSIVKKELGELNRVEFKTIFEFTQKKD